MIKDVYQSLGHTLQKDGVIVGDKLELIGTHTVARGMRRDCIPAYGQEFKRYLDEEGYDLEHRLNMEKFHYKKLASSLSHALAENYFYLQEDVNITRRAVALSSDCISTIQAKIQGNTLNLITFFRSSHYRRLLPVDMLFLLDLAPRYLHNAQHTSATFNCGWEGILGQIEYVNMHLSFGSLHTDASAGGV